MAQTLDSPVLIAGAGMAGLATAIGLLRGGIPVTVLEQAPALQEAGAGISLAPNATRALASLGLLPALRAVAQQPAEAEVRHYASGERLTGYEMGPGMEARWGAPYLQLPRTALQRLLLDTLNALDPTALRLDARVTALQQHAHGVSVETTAGRFDGPCLLAADGVRSIIRSTLFDQPAPHFLGYVAWRTILPRDAVEATLDPDTAVYLGPSRSLLRYLMDGGQSVNVAAFARTDTWTGQGWSQPADGAAIEAAFDGWHDEARAVARAMARCGATQWGLFGRPYLERWRSGRVVLVGDAAHPVLPFLGQGAAMGIEDGVVLARALVECDGLDQALLAYERERFPRATETMRRADRQGLRIHGYIDEGLDAEEAPRDDFAEYAYDAARVDLGREPVTP